MDKKSLLGRLQSELPVVAGAIVATLLATYALDSLVSWKDTEVNKTTIQVQSERISQLEGTIDQFRDEVSYFREALVRMQRITVDGAYGRTAYDEVLSDLEMIKKRIDAFEAYWLFKTQSNEVK